MTFAPQILGGSGHFELEISSPGATLSVDGPTLVAGEDEALLGVSAGGFTEFLGQRQSGTGGRILLEAVMGFLRLNP